MMAIDVDSRGYPILLAEEGSVSSPPATAKVSSLAPSTRPTSVDHLEWARRQDAVREAAREFEVLSEQDLRERLRGATSKPLVDGDIAQFTVDVRAAALDDLVDVLDQATRGKLRGRRTVRVNAPRGYVAKTVRSLTPVESDQVEQRLRARGWSELQMQTGFRSKLSKPKVDDGTLLP